MGEAGWVIVNGIIWGEEPCALAVARARFVAEHWRDAALAWRDEGVDSTVTSAVAHPLNMVLNALDGETDPAELGLTPDAHEAFRALEGSTPT